MPAANFRRAPRLPRLAALSRAPSMDLPPDFALHVFIGFAAQLVDGALGMAYGVTASTLLLGAGMPPAAASATVHAAECFTTGASAVSHRAFGNVDGRLFRRLLLPAVVGAALGAWTLARVDGDALKPWIAGYLLIIGATLLHRAATGAAPRQVPGKVAPLGFFGAFADAFGGGGWGAIVAGRLLARGGGFRLTIGSVNAVEFFVTATASAVFLLTLGTGHWATVLALALGGVAAAPLGAWLVGRLPARPMLGAVGVVIVALSVNTVLESLQ